MITQVNQSNYYNPYSNNEVEKNNTNNTLLQTKNTEANTDIKDTTDTNQKSFTEVPKQEIVSLYYNYQSTQLNKDLIEIYTKNGQNNNTSDESITFSFQDIHKLNKQQNRGEVLENISSVPKNERNIDNEELVNTIKENIKNPIDNSEITKEQAIPIYLNQQINQSNQNKIDIYTQNSLDNQETDNTYESTNEPLDDLNQLHKQVMAGQILDTITAS